MFCTPPATTRSAVPLITACAAKCTACCDEPHWRSTVVPGTSSGSPADEPARAGDVAGLRADRVDAAEHDVVDRGRVDVGALDQRADRVGAEIGRVHLASPPPRLPDGRAHGVDDVGLGHGGSSSSRVRLAGSRVGDAGSRCQAARRPSVDGPSAQARFMQRCRSYSVV